MNCEAIKKNNKKICIADFDKRIKIQTSSIKGSNNPNSSATIGFTTLVTVWAMVKTNSNYSFIDGVNTQDGINTDFYIRYSSSVPLDKQLWVEYNNNKFKITNTPENIDKDNQIIRLRSTEKGVKTVAANTR